MQYLTGIVYGWMMLGVILIALFIYEWGFLFLYPFVWLYEQNRNNKEDGGDKS